MNEGGRRASELGRRMTEEELPDCEDELEALLLSSKLLSLKSKNSKMLL
jgi:hypothetical protein